MIILPSEKTIKSLLDLQLSAKEFRKRLEFISSVLGKVKKLEDEKQNLKDTYEKDMMYLDEELRKIQDQCCHEDTIYNPDPSGNSDSYYECAICKKIL